MTAVLDPDVLTGFHDGPVYYSAEDGRFYLLTDDGAIPADGPRYATTLDAAQLSMCGADHFTLRSDGTVDMMRPASPYTAAYEDTIMGMHFPGGLGLMGASGSSSLRKRLALNFLSGGSLDPRITFTRASSATRVNSSGLIETVSSDVARFDYDPVTLAAKGLLIEEQRTNLLLRSQQFDNASWGKSLGAVTADAAVAPDGTTSADRWVSAGGAYPQIAQTITAPAGDVTVTVYVKSDGTSQIAQALIFDGVTVAFTPTSVWTRVTLNKTGGAGGSKALVIVTNSGSAPASSYYIWGAQLEAGSFQTSYIPTTSATVTRAADVASMTGTNFSDWYNQTEGTFAISLVPKGMPSTNWRFLAAGNAAGTARSPLMYSASTGTAYAQYRDGGVNQANLAHSAVFAANTRLRLASAYKVNDFASVANGGAPQTDAAGTIGTVDRLTIGWETSTPSEVFNGWIETLTYYPARLSNALLQSLTA